MRCDCCVVYSIPTISCRTCPPCGSLEVAFDRDPKLSSGSMSKLDKPLDALRLKTEALLNRLFVFKSKESLGIYKRVFERLSPIQTALDYSQTKSCPVCCWPSLKLQQERDCLAPADLIRLSTLETLDKNAQRRWGPSVSKAQANGP